MLTKLCPNKSRSLSWWSKASKAFQEVKTSIANSAALPFSHSDATHLQLVIDASQVAIKFEDSSPFKATDSSIGISFTAVRNCPHLYCWTFTTDNLNTRIFCDISISFYNLYRNIRWMTASRFKTPQQNQSLLLSYNGYPDLAFGVPLGVIKY